MHILQLVVFLVSEQIHVYFERERGKKQLCQQLKLKFE